MAKLIDTISQRLAARSNRQKQQAKARSQKGKHRTFETNTGRFSRRAKSIIRSWFQRQKIFNVGCTKKTNRSNLTQTLNFTEGAVGG